MQRVLLAAMAAFCLAASAGHASAQGVEYVKVCSAYGAGYYYMPGTEKCVHANTGVTKELTPERVVTGKTAIAKKADDAVEGAAAAAALSRPYIETGHKFAIAGDLAEVGEAGSASLGGALRLNDNLTLSGAAAITDGSATAARTGFNLSW
jgi:hypothetical protein